MDALINIVVALPFASAGLFFLNKGMKRTSAFFVTSYWGNSKQKFKDSIMGNLYLSLGISFFVVAGFSAIGNLHWMILPTALCFGTLILPIGVLGLYWRKFQAEKLWDEHFPSGKLAHSNEPLEPTIQQKVDLSGVKTPRRMQLTAALSALLFFGATFYLLNQGEANISFWPGLLIKLFISFLLAFGAFMTIVSSDLSRRVQKLREGEPIDDD